MLHSSRWMAAALVVAGLGLTACSTAAPRPAKVEPAHVEKAEGSNPPRVIVTEHAATRLGIQTAPLREEPVMRKRIVGAQVVAPGGAKALVRVPLSAGELKDVARDQPARVLPLAIDRAAAGATARPVEVPAVGDLKDAGPALYFALDGADPGLTPGQRVRAEIALSGSGMSRKVIPYSAVLYDLKGDTWAFTSPAPLTFVRQRIAVDYIEHDTAVLLSGPAAGTAVVTVGAAELFGTESGVGH